MADRQLTEERIREIVREEIKAQVTPRSLKDSHRNVYIPPAPKPNPPRYDPISGEEVSEASYCMRMGWGRYANKSAWVYDPSTGQRLTDAQRTELEEST